MKRVAASFLTLLPATAAVLAGCGYFKPSAHEPVDVAHYQTSVLNISYPLSDPAEFDCVIGTPAPRIDLDEHVDYWDLTLEETVQIALANTNVLKDLGGLIVRAPSTVRTSQDPAITETDPRFGVEAALAAFDAQFASSVIAQNNDRELNNTFFGGGTRKLQQDLLTAQSQITKRNAVGTEFAVRSITEYDANNAPGNAFPSAWQQIAEAEFRQPLLQGAGLYFNRIAGVANAFGQQTAIPGVYNGVLVARINTDISLADFELGVRNFANDVENAYLELYFAYRDLQARVDARNAALETWRRVRALQTQGAIGGEAEKEAQAREQYFRFEEAVQNALTGKLVEGTRTGSGTTGGTFRGTGGVLVAERRLRLLMGVSMTDGRLIRPIDEPQITQVVFDWDGILNEAIARRVELRRQRWEIKARELELIASRNFLLPRLDIIGRWRFRGLGDQLATSGPEEITFPDGSTASLDAFDQLFSGDFQEQQLGLEMNVPFGFRRGHAAVRNAELRLARERAVLHEQERTVVFELSNALAEADRAFDVAQTNYNRREAARAQLDAIQTKFENEGAGTLDLLLDAQRRMADADSNYYRALVEYATAIKNIHFEKGSLLDYNNIYLEEGPSPAEAHEDAAERARLQTEPLDLPLLRMPRLLSPGPAPQETLPPAPAPGAAYVPGPAMDGGTIPAPAPMPSEAPPSEPQFPDAFFEGGRFEEISSPFSPAGEF